MYTCKNAEKRRIQEPGGHPNVTKFGDLVTCGHFLTEDVLDEGYDGERCALVIYDVATKWIQCIPLKNKSAELARRAIGVQGTE